MIPGQVGPDGPWPSDVFLFGPSPQSLNERGDVVFSVHSRRGKALGVYRWDAASGQVLPVARAGMAAGPMGTFTDLVDAIPLDERTRLPASLALDEKVLISL